jgi:hypothetical protein
MSKFLFSPGQIVSTPGALDALEVNEIDPRTYLRRHLTGDWGDVCEEDRKENELSLKRGYRLMSVYKLNNGQTLWIITEADRSATTFLLPEEY